MFFYLRFILEVSELPLLETCVREDLTSSIHIATNSSRAITTVSSDVDRTCGGSIACKSFILFIQHSEEHRKSEKELDRFGNAGHILRTHSLFDFFFFFFLHFPNSLYFQELQFEQICFRSWRLPSFAPQIMPRCVSPFIFCCSLIFLSLLIPDFVATVGVFWICVLLVWSNFPLL